MNFESAWPAVSSSPGVDQRKPKPTAFEFFKKEAQFISKEKGLFQE